MTIVQLTEPVRQYPASFLAKASKVVATNGKVVKDRKGIAGRMASARELEDAVEFTPRAARNNMTPKGA